MWKRSLTIRHSAISAMLTKLKLDGCPDIECRRRSISVTWPDA